MLMPPHAHALAHDLSAREMFALLRSASGPYVAFHVEAALWQVTPPPFSSLSIYTPSSLLIYTLNRNYHYFLLVLFYIK